MKNEISGTFEPFMFNFPQQEMVDLLGINHPLIQAWTVINCIEVALLKSNMSSGSEVDVFKRRFHNPANAEKAWDITLSFNPHSATEKWWLETCAKRLTILTGNIGEWQEIPNVIDHMFTETLERATARS